MNSKDLNNLQEAYLDVYEADDPMTGFANFRAKMEREEEEKKARKKTTSNSTSSQSKQTSSGETTAQRARRDPEFRRQMIRDRMKTMSNEGYDLYDLILTHLLDEGYAETLEQAEVIMVNMSEDWRESICEGHKPLPKRMAKQARRIAFSHGTDVNSDEGSSGNVRHSNPVKALATMARIGGKKVKSYIKKGYEQGSKYDPYYQELNSRNPSRNKEV